MRIYSRPTQPYNVFFSLRPVIQKGISTSLWILIFYHFSQKGAKNSETVFDTKINIKVWRVAVIAENCSLNPAVHINVYIVRNKAKLSKVKQSRATKAEQSTAERHKAEQSRAEHGKAGQSIAKQSRAEHRAMQSRDKQSRA